MERVALGKSELQVSRLALGTMNFGWTADGPASFAILDTYIEAGGNLLDSADIYSYWVRGNHGGESERIIGRWLKARGNRDQVIIATKGRGRTWPGKTGEGLGRDHLIRACEDSLRRLQIETIDLYQFHWFDEATPVEESLRAMADLVAAGKVRYLGCSNYPPDRLREALETSARHSLLPFVSLQPHYNLVHRSEFEDELRGVCISNGLGVIPYSPLAKGLLTGRYIRGAKLAGGRANGVKEYLSEAAWTAVDAVRALATARGSTPAAVALAWLLAQPGVTAPIVGASTVAQLFEQLPAPDLSLTDAELAALTT